MPELELTTETQPLIAISAKAEGCADWVLRGGGTPQRAVLSARNSLDGVSGLLLTDGGDVSPALYGEVNRCSKRVDPGRDRFELDLLQQALSRDLPILAVCRGMQLLAVAFGGSLYQDLSELASNVTDHENVCHRGPDHTDTTHPVDIRAHTLLATCLSRKSLLVNSHHHQGIRDIPSGLRIAACSRDGLIEAIEHSSRPSVLGVQWHPERWPTESSDAIMMQFLAACRGCR